MNSWLSKPKRSAELIDEEVLQPTKEEFHRSIYIVRPIIVHLPSEQSKATAAEDSHRGGYLLSRRTDFERKSNGARIVE